MVEWYYQISIGHPSRGLEDRNAVSYSYHRGPAQEASEENNVSNWARDLACDILANNATVSSSCLKSLAEARLKNNGLISSTEISRQPNIDCHMVISDHSYTGLQ